MSAYILLSVKVKEPWGLISHSVIELFSLKKTSIILSTQEMKQCSAQSFLFFIMSAKNLIKHFPPRNKSN